MFQHRQATGKLIFNYGHNSVSKKFDAGKLHAQFGYQASSSYKGAPNGIPPVSKAKTTAKATTSKIVDSKSGIRPMPV